MMSALQVLAAVTISIDLAKQAVERMSPWSILQVKKVEGAYEVTWRANEYRLDDVKRVVALLSLDWGFLKDGDHMFMFSLIPEESMLLLGKMLTEIIPESNIANFLRDTYGERSP